MSLVLTVLGQTIVVAEAFNTFFIISQVICIACLAIYLGFISAVALYNTRHLGLISVIFSSPTALISILFPPLCIFAFSYFMKTVYNFIHPTYIYEIRRKNEVVIPSNENFRLTEFQNKLSASYVTSPEFDVINRQD